jgi:hypothetical protein
LAGVRFQERTKDLSLLYRVQIHAIDADSITVRLNSLCNIILHIHLYRSSIPRLWLGQNKRGVEVLHTDGIELGMRDGMGNSTRFYSLEQRRFLAAICF